MVAGVGRLPEYSSPEVMAGVVVVVMVFVVVMREWMVMLLWLLKVGMVKERW